jgi:putative component of membrane protein insertase Oxa1/YidC/SpoIIIJ protein YidD
MGGNGIPIRRAGALFSFVAAVACAQADVRLAAELAANGDWTAARREALRAVTADPQNDVALLLAAEIALQIDARNESGRRVLAHLSEVSPDKSVAARAAYIAGGSYWHAGDARAAWPFFARAFRTAEDRSLFLRSGCALFLLREQDKRLGADDPDLLLQLAACRDLWTFELRAEVRPDAAPARRARPAEWIVGFYRAQIAPAIGHRCSLDPSCSEYFLQAGRAHGWLGVPLIGDRLIRESGVVQAAESPIERDGRTLFQDPLELHTEWLRR